MAEAEREKKKSLIEILNETLQWFVFGGLLFKKGAPPQTGPDGQSEIEVPKVPAWIMSKFHFLTTEDEQEYDQIMDRFSSEIIDQNIFFAFKNQLVAEGYDEDFLRLMLVNLNRDWLNRKDAKKTDIPNSAIEFITHIVFLNGNYDFQKKLAKEKKFLKKVSAFKKFFIWSLENRGKTLAILALIPVIILALIILILE